MNCIDKVTVLVLISLLCIKSAIPTDYTDEEISTLKENTESFVNEILKCRLIVGMNVAVVKGQQTLFTEGYGQTDFTTKKRPTNETLFGLCSLTKGFTTFSLAKALHEKGFNWKTPMKEMLPDFELSDEFRTNSATAEDLASHSMGSDSHHLLRFQESIKTKKDILKKLKYIPYKKEYRRSNIYNNLMYNVLAHLTEELRGTSWEDSIRKDIIDALGMNSTNFFHEMEIDESLFATSYRETVDGWKTVDYEAHRMWGEMGGSGSLVSNANDMAKWIKLLVNNGRDENGKKLITEWQLKKLFTASSIMHTAKSVHQHKKPAVPVTLDFRTYGLGWRMGTYRGYSITSHTGTSLGYGGLITILHEPKITIYTGITGIDYAYMGRYLVHFYLIDQILKENPRWPNISTACSYNKIDDNFMIVDFPKEVKQPEENIHKFVGTYQNDAYGDLHFYIRNGTFKVKYSNFYEWDLQSLSNSTFFAYKDDLYWFLKFNVTFNTSTPEKISAFINIYPDKELYLTFTRDLVLNDNSNETIPIADILSLSSYLLIAVQIISLIIMFFILKKIKNVILKKWSRRNIKNNKIS